MLCTVGDVEVLLGALQAAYAGLRSSPKGPATAAQTSYLQTLLELESFVLGLSPSAAAASMVGKGTAERLIAISVDHAALGLLPWLTVLAWLRVLHAALQVVDHERHSLAHVTLSLWEGVRRMSRDHGQRTYSAPAVCATLHIFRLLLAYAPVEFRDAGRRDLPHPVKNASLAVRVAGYQLAPLLIANLSQPSANGGSAAAAAPPLSADMYEYLRKGLTSSEYAVREAVVEAVRAVLAMGVVVDTYTAPLLLAQLLAATHEAELTSARLEAAAGAAIGLLLVLFQTGRLAGAPVEGPPTDGPWLYFGGRTAPEAGRVIRALFQAGMSRQRQQVLATAVATLLGHCCPTPDSLRAPLRALFVLLVPVEGDTRAYMPRIIASALTQYAQQQPTNSHRVGLLVELGDYVRRTSEDRAIVHTALLAVEGVVPLLASARLASLSMEADIMAALAAQPAPLMHVVSSIAGGLALHGPYYQHRLLVILAESSGRVVEGDIAASEAFPRELIFALRAVLAAAAAHEAGDDGNGGEGRRPFLRPAFADHLLALAVHLAVAGTPDGSDDRAAAPAQEQSRADEAYNQRIEYFFLIAALLLTHFPSRVSTFMADKLSLAANQFASALVSTPSPSAACLRAMCAACQYYTAQPTPTVTQRSLCMGFLEMQLSAAAGEPDAPTGPLLLRLRGGVYRVIARGSWADHKDTGSLTWVVTQALRDVEEACRAVVPIVVPAAELFPARAAELMECSLRLVPTAAQRAQAGVARQAALLIAHGMVALSTASPGFCSDVLARLQRLIAAVDAGLTAPAPALGGGGAGEADVVRAWNLLLVMHAMLQRALGAAAEVAERWATEYHAHTRVWEAAVLRWSAAAPVLDVVVLGRLVVGEVWALARTVDTDTARTIMTQQPTSGAGVGAAAAAALQLAVAHALCRPLNGGAASMTLPMAVSFIGGDLQQRCSPLGDPCSSAALTVLLSAIVMAEAYPVEAAPVIAEGLASALLSTNPPALDPLVQSLVLVLLSTLTDGGGLSDTLSAHRAVAALRAAFVRRVVALSRPTCRSREEAADVRLAGTLIGADGAEGASAPAVRLLRRRLAAAAAGLDRTGRPPFLLRPPLAAHALVAQVGSAGLADPTACALARAWAQIASLAGVEDVRVLELARLADGATSRPTRRAWRAAGVALVEREAAAAANDPLRVSGLVELVRALRAVLLAHAPDLGASGGAHDEAALSAGPGADADADAGPDDEEGLETMLGSAADDLRNAAAGRRRRGGARAGADCASSDVAAKVLAYKLLLRVVEVGWPMPAADDGAATASLPAASPLAAPVLDLLVMVLPLATGIPELLPGAMAVLAAVLHRLQPLPRAAVEPWRVPLVAALRAVLELAPFHSAAACAVGDAFLQSPFADDGGVRRVAAALVTLLATMEHLDGLCTPHLGRVCLALCRLLVSAARPATLADGDSPRWPTARAVAAAGLQSVCGQTALTALCAQVVSAVAVANGFEPSAEWADLPRQHWDSAGSLEDDFTSVEAGRVVQGGGEGGAACGVGDLLEAVGCTWGTALDLAKEDTDDGDTASTAMGPSLRHAVGCLACVVVAAQGVDTHPLSTVAALLPERHQRLLRVLAHRRLIGGGLLSADSESDLLLVMAATPAAREAVTPAMAEELAAALLGRSTPPSVVGTGYLLSVLLWAGVAASDPARLARLLELLPVDYICAAPECLVSATAAALGYLTSPAPPAGPRLSAGTLTALAPSGWVLCERAWLFAASELARASPDATGADVHVSKPVALAALLRQPPPLRGELLTEAAASSVLVAFDLCSSPAVLAACLTEGSSAGVESLAVLLPRLRLAAVLMSSETVEALSRYGPVACELLKRAMGQGAAQPSRDAVELVIRLLLEVLGVPGEAAAVRAVVLRPVGAHLVQVVAKHDPQAIRGVIQSLPPARVAVLRRFMEDAATAAPSREP